MVLTEAFAAGTPVVASDIAGYRDVVADGVDGLLVPRGDATQLAETLRDLAHDPARIERAGRRRRARSAERYAWPRVAEQVVDGLRGRARRPAARGRGRARRDQASACCPPTAWSASAGAPPAVARARARRRPRPRSRGARLLGGAALATVAGSYLAVQHIGLERIGDALVRSSPAWVLLGAGADVRLDAAARRLLARDPEGGAARRAAADGRRRPGHDDRRADVGDAARAARRALARAGRRAPARPRARPAAGRPRHDRLADADQRARAGDPRRRDVHDDRAVRRPPAGAAVVRPGADRRCSASCSSRPR